MDINSTTEKLSQRTAKIEHIINLIYISHINPLKHHPNSMKSFDEFGVENCKMFLIEECPYQNRKQLQKEGEYIENDKSRLNRCIVGGT